MGARYSIVCNKASPENPYQTAREGLSALEGRLLLEFLEIPHESLEKMGPRLRAPPPPEDHARAPTPVSRAGRPVSRRAIP